MPFTILDHLGQKRNILKLGTTYNLLLDPDNVHNIPEKRNLAVTLTCRKNVREINFSPILNQSKLSTQSGILKNSLQTITL